MISVDWSNATDESMGMYNTVIPAEAGIHVR